MNNQTCPCCKQSHEGTACHTTGLSAVNGLVSQINHRIEFVEGPFDIGKGKLACVPYRKYNEVLICFKESMNVPFAKIKLHSRDRYTDAKAVFDDAVRLGQEIVKRWNSYSG